MSWTDMFLREGGIWAVVCVVIVLTVGAVAIARMFIAHRERMARIERGIDPDQPQDK